MAEPRRTAVLFVHGPPNVGGDSVVVLRTLEHLDLQRFEPIVTVAPDSEAWHRFGAVAEARGIELVPLPLGVVSHLEKGLPGHAAGRSRAAAAAVLARATLRLLRLVLRRDVDVIYTMDRSRAVVPALLAARALRRGLVWHGHCPWNSWGWVVRNADRVAVITDFVRREYARHGVSAERMRVVYNGIDTDFYAGADPSAARRRLGLTAETPLVVMPGRLSRSKGQLELVEAMPAILARHPETRFVFAGGDSSELGDLATAGTQSMRAVIEARLHALGVADRANLLRPSDKEMADLLAAGDVAVVPSWEEPFGLVVIEAMAAGTAVVGSAAGGIPESIVDGETGLLVPPRTPDAIATAVAALLDDPARRRAMGRAGQARVRSRFTVERYCRELEQVLTEAAPRQRRPAGWSNATPRSRPSSAA